MALVGLPECDVHCTRVLRSKTFRRKSVGTQNISSSFLIFAHKQTSTPSAVPLSDFLSNKAGRHGNSCSCRACGAP